MEGNKQAGKTDTRDNKDEVDCKTALPKLFYLLQKCPFSRFAMRQSPRITLANVL